MKRKSRKMITMLVVLVIGIPLAFSTFIQPSSAAVPPYYVHLTFGTGSENDENMHVTWFTPTEAPTEVRFDIISRSDPSQYMHSTTGEHAFYSNVNRWIHDANMTDLMPNTRYYYRVGSDEGWSTERSFVSGLDTEFESFNFVAYGDTRSGASDRQKVLNAINWEVDNNDVRFVLHDGDIVDDANSIGEWNDWFGDSETVASKVPVMAIEGNHDDLGGICAVQFYNPHNGPVQGDAGYEDTDYSYWFTYGNVLVINLGWEFNYADIDSEDYDWLRSVFDMADIMKASGYIHWTVMQWHSPPYNSGLDHKEDMEKRNIICPLIEERGVDAVFNGHEHIYERSYQVTSPEGNIVNAQSTITQDVNDDIPGTIYFVAGGGGAPRVPLICVMSQKPYSADYACINSYALLEVTKSATQTTLRISGKGDDHDTFDDGVLLIKTGLTPPVPPTDEEDPTVNVPTYDATPVNHLDLSITAQALDTGNSHLRRAKIVWGYNQDPLETSPYRVWANNTPVDSDDFLFEFTIGSDYLNTHLALRMQFWVYDWAGNKVGSPIYTVNPVDGLAPQIEVKDHSYYWDDTLNGGCNVAELGYTLEIDLKIIEPVQSSGIPNNNDNLYIGIKDGNVDGTNVPTGATDYNELIPFSTIHEFTYTYQWTYDFGYESGDWFHVLLYAEDGQGNSAWPFLTFYVADNSAPDVIEGDGNLIDPDFDQNIVLEFASFEPAIAEGVNATSISFNYTIDDPDMAGAGIPLAPISSSDSATYCNRTYQINTTQFEYNDTIYYSFYVEDLAGNIFSTGVRNLTVQDRYAPTYVIETEFSKSNWSIFYTSKDVHLTVTANDQPEGSGMDTILLYYINYMYFIDYGETIEYWDHFEPSNVVGSEYEFIIPKEKISIEGIVFSLRVYDKAGNFAEWRERKTVYYGDNIDIAQYIVGTVNGYYLNSTKMDFHFQLTAPAFIFTEIDAMKSYNYITTNVLSTRIEFSGEGKHTIGVFFNEMYWSKEIIVDMTAPPSVENIKARRDGNAHVITWKAPASLDPNEYITYRVYVGTTNDFDIEEGILIEETKSYSYTYTMDGIGEYYYRVVVVDGALNESPISPSSDPIVEADPVPITIITGGIIGAVVGVALIVQRIKKHRNFCGIDDDAASTGKSGNLIDKIRKKFSRS